MHAWSHNNGFENCNTHNVHVQKLYITMITETLTNIGLAVFTCYYKYHLKLYIILILFSQFTTSTILLLYINLETIACTYTGFCFYICLHACCKYLVLAPRSKVESTVNFGCLTRIQWKKYCAHLPLPKVLLPFLSG